MKTAPLPSERCGSCAVALEEVAYRYGQSLVLQNVGLAVSPGEIVSLLGPSGCGKTTLLRLVAGLLEPSAGRICIGGAVVADAATRRFVPPERRGLGMVFQDYALWPHFDVGSNVAFPLEMRGVPARDRRARVDAALERVGLGGFADRSVASLSGGQQQRVAIARAVVAEPRIVLFDEPLSNLDRELRDLLAGEIATLVRSLDLTAIYVTHDQAEAFALAHTVAVMQAGRIVQNVAPEILVRQPATPEVAEFLNLGPVVAAERTPDGWLVPGTALRLGFDPAQDRAPDAARVLLAHKAFSLTEPGTGNVTGTVAQSLFRGDTYSVMVRLGAAADAVAVRVRSSRRVEAGERVGLQIDASQLRWFPSPRQKEASC
jgi:iron(III) transport system ATP-binding protein